MSNAGNHHRQVRIKRQFYLDSVALMRLSRELTEQTGVHEAALMMGTPANLEIMANAGLLVMPSDSNQIGNEAVGSDEFRSDAGSDPSPGDLVICVNADSEVNALGALELAEQRLSQPQQVGGGELWRPRSISRAIAEHPDANLVVISVSGAFAVSEARKAIRRGLNVMIFSDNVPVRDELAIKREAEEQGVLVMGPDCGTCVINGVPLAFANQLPRGDIGIIGASGTGIQEVGCLLSHSGHGISHAIGVGGRDLSDEVGALSTLMALDALDADDGTKHIVMIGKPPGPAIVDKVMSRVANSSKRFTICFLGAQKPELPINAQWAPTLQHAAAYASGVITSDDHDASRMDWSVISELKLIEQSNQQSRELKEASELKSLKNIDQSINAIPSEAHLVRGLFSGGTLCAEAQLICREAGLTVASNAAIANVSSELAGDKHTLLDLGADEYTQGKPHPMIDPSIRDQMLEDALNDSRCAVVLLDVVIGYGAHPDPAGHLVQSLPENLLANGISIVASVTGTDEDPQVRSRQIDKLQRAGVTVATSNAQATLLAIEKVKALAS